MCLLRSYFVCALCLFINDVIANILDSVGAYLLPLT